MLAVLSIPLGGAASLINENRLCRILAIRIHLEMVRAMGERHRMTKREASKCQRKRARCAGHGTVYENQEISQP